MKLAMPDGVDRFPFEVAANNVRVRTEWKIIDGVKTMVCTTCIVPSGFSVLATLQRKTEA